MFGLNTLIAAFNAWRHNVGNILLSFEKTQQRLLAAADHHGKLADWHVDQATLHTVRADVHKDESARASIVSEKIGALIN